MTEIKLPYQRQMNKKIRKPLKQLPTPNLKPLRCFVPLLACSKTSPNPFEAPQKENSTLTKKQKKSCRLGSPSKKKRLFPKPVAIVPVAGPFVFTPGISELNQPWRGFLCVKTGAAFSAETQF